MDFVCMYRISVDRLLNVDAMVTYGENVVLETHRRGGPRLVVLSVDERGKRIEMGCGGKDWHG
jgi:hypothetical protein